jgi:hypothetical protein
MAGGLNMARDVEQLSAADLIARSRQVTAETLAIIDRMHEAMVRGEQLRAAAEAERRKDREWELATWPQDIDLARQALELRPPRRPVGVSLTSRAAPPVAPAGQPTQLGKLFLYRLHVCTMR